MAGKGVFACSDADNRTRTIFYQLLYRDAEDKFRSGGLRLVAKPLVERGCENGIGIACGLSQVIRAVVERHGGSGIEHAQALMGDLSLEGIVGLPIEVLALVFGDDALQRMGVHAPTRHVLRARIFTAIDKQRGFALLGGNVRRGRAGAACAHDDDVEIAFFHAIPSLYFRKDKSARCLFFAISCILAGIVKPQSV